MAEQQDADELERLFAATSSLRPTPELAEGVMRQVEHSLAPEERLDQLLRATADLEPSDELAERVDKRVAHSETSLERSLAGTLELSPSDGLLDAVMRRVAASELSALPVVALPVTAPGGQRRRAAASVSFIDGITRSSRAALIAAAAVAAASIGFSVYSEASFDEGIMAAVDSVDVGD